MNFVDVVFVKEWTFYVYINSTRQCILRDCVFAKE